MRDQWPIRPAVILTFFGLLPGGCQLQQPTDYPDDAGGVDSVDRYVWFTAADEGDAGILQSLIEDGIDPLIERDGLTALHVVASEGHLDATRLLIDAGLDVNIGPDATQAEIASVATHGSPRLIELMMGTTLDPQTVAIAVNLRSPLNLAVENGHCDVAELLIEAGADVDAGGVWYRPLHSAIIYGDEAAVELLLENGADVDTMIRIQDRSAFSGFRYAGPVEIAQIIERDDLVELLRDYGGRK